jgi:hypothetical protein
MKLITTMLAISLLIQPLASAHDASLHKGKATTGEVVSVSDDKMEMKTPTGPVTITLNAKTKYEHGSKAAAKSHLQKGQQVSVFGTKLPTGELVAKEIVIAAPDSHATHK